MLSLLQSSSKYYFETITKFWLIIYYYYYLIYCYYLIFSIIILFIIILFWFINFGLVSWAWFETVQELPLDQMPRDGHVEQAGPRIDCREQWPAKVPGKCEPI